MLKCAPQRNGALLFIYLSLHIHPSVFCFHPSKDSIVAMVTCYLIKDEIPL